MSDLEVRVDPLSGRKTIIATGRASRPGGGLKVEPRPPIDPQKDPFLEGHEDQTPPEVYARRPNGSAPNSPGWLTRVVPNLYPALEENSDEPPAHANPDLFTAQPAAGAHEVIVNSPKALTSLSDLSLEELEVVLDTWRQRIQAHSDAAYVHLALNEGDQAGASLPHTHAQLYAFEFVPRVIARERERFAAYATRTLGANLLSDLVQAEVREKKRVIAIDETTVLLTPYAPQASYQLLLAPRNVYSRFDEEQPSCAPLLYAALQKLKHHLQAVPPLNLWIRTAPRGAEHFCWRIDIFPRLTTFAGLELGAGLNLCIVSPEQAAEELRSVD